MDEDLTGELWPGGRRRKNQGRRGALISWEVVNAERHELIPGALCCPPAAVADLKRHCFAILAALMELRMMVPQAPFRSVAPANSGGLHRAFRFGLLV
jgi:hypothetical protein